MARKDYKKLLVDAGRNKYQASKRVKDDDMDVTKAPMRNHKEYWNPRDYTAPLYRYLHKQVGRPWDKIYSELCANADNRSLLGEHLRQHVWDIVIENHLVTKTSQGYRYRPRWSHGADDLIKFNRHQLFIDDHGILRAPREKELISAKADSQWAQIKREQSRHIVVVNKTSYYVKVDNIWWYVETNGQLDSKVNDPKVFYRGHGEIEWTMCKLLQVPRKGYWDPEVIIPTYKRQIGKKESKNLGLAA